MSTTFTAPPALRPVATPSGVPARQHRGCPACNGQALMPVLTMHAVPTNSCLMLSSPEEARAFPRGDIDLMFCEACGFVFNHAFDERLTEYSERYEPTQAYSGTFRAFHQDLAARLVAGTGLAGGTVVEVGCGQGEFLHLVCRLAGSRGIGFDPCLSAARADVVRDRAEGVSLIGDFFADASVEGLRAELLVSKMTLEHIPTAGHFAGLTAQVARNSPPGMQLFIQIPECERIFGEGAFEDIYYEHCNYFTEASLVGLFARHGFAVETVSREYAGQYLTILARFTDTPSAGIEAGEIARLRAMLQRFGAIHAERVADWRRLVQQRQADGKRVVLWGSGSKGVTFLGALGDGEGVSHVVDINPHRQGHYMVGTGHPIVAPEALVALRPATVIVMNAVYRDEVAARLAELGLNPEVLSL